MRVPSSVSRKRLRRVTRAHHLVAAGRSSAAAASTPARARFLLASPERLATPPLHDRDPERLCTHLTAPPQPALPSARRASHFARLFWRSLFQASRRVSSLPPHRPCRCCPGCRRLPGGRRNGRHRKRRPVALRRRPSCSGSHYGGTHGSPRDRAQRPSAIDGASHPGVKPRRHGRYARPLPNHVQVRSSHTVSSWYKTGTPS